MISPDPQSPRVALSIHEVCAQTGIGRDTLYKAIRGGALKARKLGRRTIVSARDLDAFLQNLPSAGGKAA
jgi:excisionase family DNA binding protein